MTLAPATRLGPYEIVAPLGAGGMGEVYRAKDPRLGREVAIKVLPAEVASDPERLRRFEQEAKAVSALNHPHIVTLYEVGQSEHGPYLVLEKIEGHSLRELLRDGALPVKRVLALGAEIAEGLAKAHGAGIVHRDLKPENVMVSDDGFAKILDFGLAKLVYPELDGAAPDQLTTLVEKTATGMIVGTLGYLSPEQAVGKPADFRSDQFALGALLYELATGERPFKKETTPETLTAILREEPEPLRVKNAALPAQLGWIVERCLSKDPQDRYASTRDLARDLSDLRDHLSEIAHGAVAGESAPARSTRVARERLLWGALCGALIAALGALAIQNAGRPPAAFAKRAGVERLTELSGIESEPTISPDAKSVVYVKNGDLWLLRVGGSNAVNLTPDSPEPDLAPAFSPDGTLLAFNSFRADGGVYVMGATGENLRRVTTRGYRPAWTPDGRELLFTNGSLAEIAYEGSTPDRLEAVDISTGQIRTVCECGANAPAVSPNGRWVAYWGIEAHGRAQRDLWLVPLAGLAAGQHPTRLTDDPAFDWSPVWEPDGRSLLFVSDRGGSPNLWRLSIDAASGRVLGSAEPETLPSAFVSSVRLAADGRTLVFASTSRATELARIPFDPRAGAADGAVASALRLADLVRGLRWDSFSPDGQWMAVQSGPSGDDIVLLKLDGSAVRTLVAAGGSRQRSPAWSPDGKTIAFATDRAGKYEIWGIASDGSNLRPLLASDRKLLDPSWSPDGSMIAAAEKADSTNAWRTLVHKTSDPPDRFEPLPALPDSDSFYAEAWSRGGSDLIGSGSQGSIWSWSVRDRSYRRLLQTGPEFTLETVSTLDDGRLLLVEDLYPGIRVELLNPVSGSRSLVLTDRGGFAALSLDRKSLWINRQQEESDLWIARFEGPER